MTTPTPGLRSRLLRGEVVLGTFLSLGSPLAAEACALGGFDWLLADLEHGGGDEGVLLGQLTAAAAHGVPLIVRTETAERIRVGRALDLGAAGIMLPRLDTTSDVIGALRHLRYPPAGDRGVANYNRSRLFGLDATTLSAADGEVLGVVQIESPQALEAIEEIASTPGVDVLFIGPGDLSCALGVPFDLSSPVYDAALDRVLEATRRHGVAAGILAGSPDAARTYISRGFRFLAIGSDATTIAQSSRATVRDLRAVPA